MEITIIIDDKLINKFTKVFTKKNAVFVFAVVLFCGGLFIFSQQVVELDTFHDGDIIYAGPINDNFTALRDRELGSLADVDVGGAADGQVLKFDGTAWAPGNDIGGSGGVWTISGSDIYYTSGNVGIGTATPGEKLEVDGGIKLGSTTNTVAGTMRWNSTDSDFEGYDGTEWQSFTEYAASSEPWEEVTGGIAYMGGSVGIGTTTNLDYTLNLGGSAWTGMGFRDIGGNLALQQWANGNYFQMGTIANLPLVFVTNSAEKMRILGNGNVGINTTNPSSTLEVDGDIEVSSGYLYLGDPNVTGCIRIFKAGGSNDLMAQHWNGSAWVDGVTLIDFPDVP